MNLVSTSSTKVGWFSCQQNEMYPKVCSRESRDKQVWIEKALTDGDPSFSPLSWILPGKHPASHCLYFGGWPWGQRRWMAEPPDRYTQPRWKYFWNLWWTFEDSLARDGVVLEQHYAQFQCTPSRSALMTSRLISLNVRCKRSCS